VQAWQGQGLVRFEHVASLAGDVRGPDLEASRWSDRCVGRDAAILGFNTRLLHPSRAPF
jgi:hypothetical protein